ncbi:hypothetical protein Ptr902_03654 [Pyrenophora tritici-repentis]|nr:hypothetical protein Ptr902_03654 [Pyrenophora tritici-repentis]
MPSSPSISSVHQAAASQLDKKAVHGYRQTMYRDEAGCQIAESRRHSDMARKARSSTQAYVDFVLYPSDDLPVSPRSYSGETLHQHPAPRRRTADPIPGLHMTSAKHLSKARPKPVIVQQTTQSSRTLSDKTKASLQTASGSRPPPTPRSARLPTPELSDLDEPLFCDCGVAGHIFKCCTSCGKEIDL